MADKRDYMKTDPRWASSAPQVAVLKERKNPPSASVVKARQDKGRKEYALYMNKGKAKTAGKKTRGK